MLRIIFVFLFLFSFQFAQSQSLEDVKKLTINEQYEASSSMAKLLTAQYPTKGEYWFWYGENLFKAEETDSAKWAYETGIKSDPANPLNFVGLGKILMSENKFTEGQAEINKALQMAGPKNPEVMIRAAEAYIISPKKDLPTAFTLLKDAEKLQPKNPEIQILNGDAFLENNDGSNAIKYYEKAQSLDPKSPLALLRIGQLWMRARNYVGKDGQKGALEYYKEAVAVNPDFAPAYRELGELYGKAQYYKEAKDNYRKYLELSNKNVSAKARYASFLFITKEYQEAYTLIKEVMSQDTSRNILNRLAAYSSYELKDYVASLNYIEKFFALQPVDKTLPSDFAYFGKILVANGKDSLGVIQLKIAYEKDTTNADVITDVAAAFAKMKRYDEAAIFYNRKINLGKAITNDYFRLGQAYYNLKEFGKADTAFMVITEKQPALGVGHFWRARSNSSLDPDTKIGLAKVHYEKFIELAEPDSTKNARELTEAYKYLGFYYYQSKDYSNSKVYWEKVMNIDPADNQAIEALKDLKTKVKG